MSKGIPSETEQRLQTMSASSPSSPNTSSGSFSADDDVPVSEKLDRLANSDDYEIVLLGKAPIQGATATIISAENGYRYVAPLGSAFIWIRPDGMGKTTSWSVTEDTLADFDTVEYLGREALNERVEETLNDFEQ